MRRCLSVSLVAIACVTLAIAISPTAHGLALVVRAADLHGIVRHLADLDTVSVDEWLVSVPVVDGSIRARVYAPRGTPRQTVLLVSGVHPLGIDEPRLMVLARRFAEANVIVVTPDIPELSRYEINPVLTDRIEQSALWLATASGLAPHGRIGLIGISFSGGLAVVAAGRPALQGRLLYVFSFGGHDDLRRVLEYYCAGIGPGSASYDGPSIGPAGSARSPHDYSLAVALLNVAEHLVPPEQVAALRSGVSRFLWASYLDGFDKTRAEREFSALRDLASTLPEPARTLLQQVNARDVTSLGPRLLPYIGSYGDIPQLSPARSPLPATQVFLIHGRADTVIPSTESRRLADRLRGRPSVRLLVTDLISHVDADQPACLIDILRLAHFWGQVLDP